MDTEINSDEIRLEMIQLTALTDELCELLLAERAALVSRNREALSEIVAMKNTKCAEIEAGSARLGTTPLSAQIAAADPAARAELDRLHTSLLTSTSQAQEYNAVNGKIVHRTQQSLRDLIHLISGMDAELLYGQQGQTMATAKGTAIARA